MSSFTGPSARRPSRKPAAAVVAVVATALCGVAALAAWNPWGYVHLGQDVAWLAAAATVVPLAAGVIGLLLARTKAVAVTLGVLCGVATLIAACGGGLAALWTDPSWDRTVLATSPSGDYQVVDLLDDGPTLRRELRVARPAGLLTRESTRPAVCVVATFGDSPKLKVTSARFVAEHEIEVTLADATTWRTTFDPGTLEPARSLAAGCLYDSDRVERVT